MFTIISFLRTLKNCVSDPRVILQAHFGPRNWWCFRATMSWIWASCKFDVIFVEAVEFVRNFSFSTIHIYFCQSPGLIHRCHFIPYLRRYSVNHFMGLGSEGRSFSSIQIPHAHLSVLLSCCTLLCHLSGPQFLKLEAALGSEDRLKAVLTLRTIWCFDLIISCFSDFCSLFNLIYINFSIPACMVIIVSQT